MEKNYNYLRKRLYLPEYGRHIHEMVDYLMTIHNRDLRNSQAASVIAVMGNLFPYLRDNHDYAHKLWDHLFIMSDFELDVDSPYPVPTEASLAPEPRRMNYSKSDSIRQKHYGRNIQNIVRSLEGATDNDTVEQVVGNIARFMRAKSYEFNQEHPDNSAIIRDIRRMSETEIVIDENAIANIKSDYRQQHYTPHIKRNVTGSRDVKNGKNGKNNHDNNLQRRGKIANTKNLK